MQGGQERGGLGLGQVAGTERGEDDAGLVLGQALALDDAAQKTVRVLGVGDRAGVMVAPQDYWSWMMGVGGGISGVA